jgi:hypothetical protein
LLGCGIAVGLADVGRSLRQAHDSRMSRERMDGQPVTFRGYSERGCPDGFDDGTMRGESSLSAATAARARCATTA